MSIPQTSSNNDDKILSISFSLFALPGHGSTSSVGRKSNAIFALPGHGSTSSVGRKSNAIFALPGHRSTSSVGRKSNAIFGRKLKIDMAAYGWKVRTSPRRIDDIHVAVKRLTKVSHDENIIIYEFMSKNSLTSLLSDNKQRKTLHWSRRVDIIKGIANGLSYLHNEATVNLIHRDIKPANILLDDNMVAKIADFGTTKNVKDNNNSPAKGTLELCSKTHMHSFSVIIHEMLNRMKAVEDGRPHISSVKSQAAHDCSLDKIVVEVEKDYECMTSEETVECKLKTVADHENASVSIVVHMFFDLVKEQDGKPKDVNNEKYV
ncbi:phosphorylase kinase, gamma catalytic subunit [Tanacetum coccineum]|uniref:Phosphorylase kinase, gamma catalytic subunit n=1 Tax=Tanacetum coccineum TaxID=301880 RepID=A0ABQ5I060_9ASTR